MSKESSRLVDAAIREILAPVLRADGFKSSGRRFHRVRGEMIHVFHVQGSKWGGKLAANLGVQLQFLPLIHGVPREPSEIPEHLCFLRRRLSAVDGTDQWWSHTDDEPSIRRALGGVLGVYEEQGREQLERFGRYPESFAGIRPGDSDWASVRGFVGMQFDLNMARIRLYEGNRSGALGFIEHAIGMCQVPSSDYEKRLIELRDTICLG